MATNHKIGGSTPSILKVMKARFSLYEQWTRFQNIFLFKKSTFFDYFLESSCSFYFGFLCGNLFGTFLIFLRSRVVWDGVLFFFLMLCFEFLNFFIYKRIRYRLFTTPTRFGVCILKNFQTGMLLGFFIDAFKVGS